MTNASNSNQLINEEELVANARGDANSFGKLYDLFFPRVYKYVLYRVDDASVADDIVSEIFERIFVTLDRFDPAKAPFGAWVFAISRHVVMDHQRRLKRHPTIPLDTLNSYSDLNHDTEMIAVEGGRRELLRAAVRGLSDREIDVIGLKFAFCLSNRQIATSLGLGESNIGVTLYRALRKLREVLKSEESCNE
jgi:RNA polymerase sigma factor (sigma-70 family)